MKPFMKVAAGILGLLALSAASASAADNFQKLSGAQISARFTGMDISDDVHWREFYGPNGALISQSMGRRKTGKWWVQKNELCIDRGKDDGGCYQVWMAGKKVEFRREGLAIPLAEGTLQKSTIRN